MPVRAGSTEPGTTPHTPGTSCASSLMAIMQVDVPTTLTTSPSRTPAPMASQCASKAPTGMGMPARSPSLPAHSGVRLPGDLVGSLIAPAEFLRARRPAADRRGQELLRRQPAQRGVPHPLVAHGADAAWNRRRVCDAAQHRRHHVAMFQRRREPAALLRDCAAASAAAWRIPTRKNRCRRTSGWPPGRGGVPPR